MNNPKYKKLAKSETDAMNRFRRLNPNKYHNAPNVYWSVIWISIGIIFITKGIVRIIWRLLH